MIFKMRFYKSVIRRISYVCFGFEGWIWVLITSVPGLYIHFTFGTTNNTMSELQVRVLGKLQYYFAKSSFFYKRRKLRAMDHPYLAFADLSAQTGKGGNRKR